MSDASSSSKTVLLVLGGVGIVAGLFGLVMLANRSTVEQEAATAFPVPKAKRPRYAALVAQALYARLRNDSLTAEETEELVDEAMSSFAGEVEDMEREAHTPVATAIYLHSLLVADGRVPGDRKEAIATIHREYFATV